MQVLLVTILETRGTNRNCRNEKKMKKLFIVNVDIFQER